MSKVKTDQIEPWRLESAERKEHLRELGKQTEAIKTSKAILDRRVIKEKEEEILREIEMEQQELHRREMKINLSINQQQQKEDVKTKRGDNASVGVKQQELFRRDLWKQLTRVSIPIFDENKTTYENWKPAFTACIDQLPATPEDKLLQLRQHLTLQALKLYREFGTFSWSL